MYFIKVVFLEPGCVKKTREKNVVRIKCYRRIQGLTKSSQAKIIEDHTMFVKHDANVTNIMFYYYL